MKASRVYLYFVVSFGARCGGWLTPRHGRFVLGNDAVLIVYVAGWAPGPVWIGAENLAYTTI